LKIFGAREVTLVDKSLRRNNCDSKERIGIFSGYRQDGPGDIIYLPSTGMFANSGDCFFYQQLLYKRQSISDDRYKDLFSQVVGKESASKFDYLIGMMHIHPENKMKYMVTRITYLKGFVVAYRAFVNKTGTHQEVDHPIHVQDIENYTHDSKHRFPLSFPPPPPTPPSRLPPCSSHPSLLRKLSPILSKEVRETRKEKSEECGNGEENLPNYQEKE
jgi:hypothetical protein